MKKNRLNNKSQIYLSLMAIVLICMCYYIFYMTPFRLDDLTWGGRIGIERLKIFFRGYNGRYLGNIAVIILTRMPRFFRSALMLFGICLLVYFVWLFFDKSKIIVSVFILCFFIMPLQIFSQTVTWISGFANYYISFLLSFIILYLDKEVLFMRGQRSKLLFFILGFASQLFLETNTIYVCFLSFLCLMLYLFMNRKLSTQLLAQAFGSCLGAVIMFSNSSYNSALEHDGATYKSINLDQNFGLFLKSTFRTFYKKIMNPWFSRNTILNCLIVLAIILFALLYEHSIKKKSVIITYGFMLAGMYAYETTDLTRSFKYSNRISFLVLTMTILYYFICVYTLVHDWHDKILFLIILISNFVCTGPLLFVSPVNDRCYFHSYCLWVLFLLYWIYLILKSDRVRIYEAGLNYYVALTAFSFLIGFLLYSYAGLSESWRIQERREAIIEEYRTGKCDAIELPKLKNSNLYSYGFNISNENVYWLNNYKDYYNIPRDASLRFVDE